MVVAPPANPEAQEGLSSKEQDGPLQVYEPVALSPELEAEYEVMQDEIRMSEPLFRAQGQFGIPPEGLDAFSEDAFEFDVTPKSSIEETLGVDATMYTLDENGGTLKDTSENSELLGPYDGLEVYEESEEAMRVLMELEIDPESPLTKYEKAIFECLKGSIDALTDEQKEQFALIEKKHETLRAEETRNLKEQFEDIGSLPESERQAALEGISEQLSPTNVDIELAKFIKEEMPMAAGILNFLLAFRGYKTLDDYIADDPSRMSTTEYIASSRNKMLKLTDGASFVSAAHEYMGMEYKMGGVGDKSSQNPTIDCSQLVVNSLRDNGCTPASFDTTAAGFRSMSQEVGRDAGGVGDFLIKYSGHEVGHIAIITENLGGGVYRTIEAVGGNTGKVVESTYNMANKSHYGVFRNPYLRENVGSGLNMETVNVQIDETLVASMPPEVKDRLSQDDLSDFQKMAILRTWKEESSLQYDGLVSWNKSESFPSLGYAHMVWKESDSFPRFMQSVRHQVDWSNYPGLQDAIFDGSRVRSLSAFLAYNGLNKTDFFNSEGERGDALYNPLLITMRKFLVDTLNHQVEFNQDRLLKFYQNRIAGHERATLYFEKMFTDPDGQFILLDYVNFKGEGGLSKTLKGMNTGDFSIESLKKDFARSAWESDLALRIEQNSSYAQYENGWKNRLERYKV